MEAVGIEVVAAAADIRTAVAVADDSMEEGQEEVVGEGSCIAERQPSERFDDLDATRVLELLVQVEVQRDAALVRRCGCSNY